MGFGNTQCVWLPNPISITPGQWEESATAIPRIGLQIRGEKKISGDGVRQHAMRLVAEPDPLDFFKEGGGVN